jgi:predicted nicotinamide N-methyase
MPYRKVYIPPSLVEIGKAVNIVFDRYSAQDSSLADPEIRQGYISFLWIAGQILAKHLSTPEDIDHPVDTSEK